jgi:hypothetical protein
MRTTVTLADDVAAAVERLRNDRGLGLSEALNELARAGMTRSAKRTQFKQQTYSLGLKIDVTDIADALELLEDSPGR